MNGKCSGPGDDDEADETLDNEDEEEDDDGAPMPVDEFFALPTFHKKKVAFYKHMVSRGASGSGEDDGT